MDVHLRRVAGDAGLRGCVDCYLHCDSVAFLPKCSQSQRLLSLSSQKLVSLPSQQLVSLPSQLLVSLPSQQLPG